MSGIFKYIKENLKKINPVEVFINLIIMFISLYFALVFNNWNLYRIEEKTGKVYLKEIRKELKDDINDIKGNIRGHRIGIRACEIFENYYLGKEIPIDALTVYKYFLTRDFICVSNTSSYEALKNKGLDIIHTDTLRFLISKVYNFRYENIEKLEEQYEEGQFFKNHEKQIILF